MSPNVCMASSAAGQIILTPAFSVSLGFRDTARNFGVSGALSWSSFATEHGESGSPRDFNLSANPATRSLEPHGKIEIPYPQALSTDSFGNYSKLRGPGPCRVAI